MPTYQYACTACDHRLESVQAFADDPLTQCPVCDGRLRKLFGSVGIVFKGPGFYRTDSRASANGNGSKNGGEGTGSGEKKSDSTATGGESTKSTSGTGTKDKTPASTASTKPSSSSS